MVEGEKGGTVRKIDINTEDLLVAHGKDVEEVLRHAVREALREHKRIGNPVAAWKDGEVVIIEPKDIPVDEWSEE
jgi:hypothetical protein